MPQSSALWRKYSFPEISVTRTVRGCIWHVSRVNPREDCCYVPQNTLSTGGILHPKVEYSLEVRYGARLSSTGSCPLTLLVRPDYAS